VPRGVSRRAGSGGTSAERAHRLLPILGDVRLDRKLGWIIALFLLLIGTIVGYNATATAHERDTALIVNVASRQRALAERYIKDVLLKVEGLPADPAEDADTLAHTAAALLNGGEVQAVRGADEVVHISPYRGNWKVTAKLTQERVLLGRLIATGNDLLDSGRDSLTFDDHVLQLRITAAQLATLSNDAVGEMTHSAQDSLGRLVRVGIVLGLLGALAAVAMGLLLRRAGAQQAAQFRSLVHNASDLITVIGSDGRVRYQSAAVERVLGFRAQDLVGTALTGRIHPDDEPHAHAVFQEISEGVDGTTKLEYRFQHGDGSWRYLESTVTNLTSDPTVGGLVLNSRDITDRKTLEEQLTHQAFHDSLTGLANRALFRDRLEHALARAARYDTMLAVLFLDLDSFKTINDSLGHDAGDELLIALAGRLQSRSRASDTVARLGGDEFAVLLEDEVDEASATAVAERIGEMLRSPFQVQGKEVFATASIGIALNRDEHGEADALLRNADVAMYAAKARARGQYEVFEPAMYERVVQHLELQADLQRGLEREEFFLNYQPILDLKTGRLEAVEALIRWNHPTRGLVAPNDFIPAAEETGLIVPIGYWVLREASLQARAWQVAYPMDPPMSISVNLSMRQLHELNLADRVRETLEESGLPPETLILEITETGLMHDVERTVDQLLMLKRLGVRLAIDDFGTGSSSLGYLRRFPIDVLKIDRSFVETLATNAPQGYALVRAIVDLAQTLQLETVAEGIEEPAQMTELQAVGCRSGQGFYFARPLDPENLERFLREGSRGGQVLPLLKKTS
jgi:diguanylate cyclase (GGDEF)-like protein/PAS domain S-box-containing protein